jgi:hypothetical protein
MFRKKVQYVFEWTVPAKSWVEIRPEFNEFAGKAVRATGIGVTIFCANFALSKLILPDLKEPAAEKLLFVVGIIAACGVLGALAARCSSEKRKYGLSDEAVHTIPTEFLGAAGFMPFKICQAWVLHDSSNRMELFTRAGDIFMFDLPLDTTLREQVVTFVQARVKPWLHLEAPSKIRVSTGRLEGRSLPIFWALTLLGSVLLASSIEVDKFFAADEFGYANNLGYYILFGRWLIGPGIVWGWNTWRKLNLFPVKKRIEHTLCTTVIANLLFTMLFVSLLTAFRISRIAP